MWAWNCNGSVGKARRRHRSMGCSIICLEPNPDFFQLAQHNCQPYSNVEIQNTSFEEWELKPFEFDAVLAASSFHWIIEMHIILLNINV